LACSKLQNARKFFLVNFPATGNFAGNCKSDEEWTTDDRKSANQQLAMADQKTNPQGRDPRKPARKKNSQPRKENFGE